MSRVAKVSADGGTRRVWASRFTAVVTHMAKISSTSAKVGHRMLSRIIESLPVMSGEHGRAGGSWLAQHARIGLRRHRQHHASDPARRDDQRQHCQSRPSATAGAARPRPPATPPPARSRSSARDDSAGPTRSRAARSSPRGTAPTPAARGRCRGGRRRTAAGGGEQRRSAAPPRRPASPAASPRSIPPVHLPPTRDARDGDASPRSFFSDHPRRRRARPAERHQPTLGRVEVRQPVRGIGERMVHDRARQRRVQRAWTGFMAQPLDGGVAPRRIAERVPEIGPHARLGDQRVGLGREQPRAARPRPCAHGEAG